jgi:drug/metabolite transporter (DMT)-like permease
VAALGYSEGDQTRKTPGGCRREAGSRFESGLNSARGRISSGAAAAAVGGLPALDADRSSRSCPGSRHGAGLSLTYLALFCSALTNFLDGCILSRRGPIVISPHMILPPVASLWGGIFLLGKTLIRDQIVGGALILADVLIVTMN